MFCEEKFVMRFFIRVDASEQIGAGHVVRCLTLADELQKNLHEVIFLSMHMPEHFISLMKKKGISFNRLVSTHSVGSIIDATTVLEFLQSEYAISIEDCLIIDNYQIDHIWETVLKQSVGKIVVIDDLANRQHVCDLLLDTNAYDLPEKRYEGLLPVETKKLLGAKYSLLREEFSEVRNLMLKKQISRRTYTNILICFGGSDPTNETMKAINALVLLLDHHTGFELTVILGRANPNIQTIQERCKGLKKVRCIIQPQSMALEMSRAHVAVCGGGTMTWERYCLGLPALVIAIAENQIGIAQQGEKRNIDKYLGESKFVNEQIIRDELLDFLKSSRISEATRQKAMNLVDGEGVKRVTRMIMDNNI